MPDKSLRNTWIFFLLLIAAMTAAVFINFYHEKYKTEAVQNNSLRNDHRCDHPLFAGL